jgi:hypothetical protein
MSKKRDARRWKMLKVSTVGNRFEEDVVSQALEEEGIPFMIRRYSDTAYDGIFIPQKGWASVMVPDEFMEKAKAIIKGLKRDFENED